MFNELFYVAAFPDKFSSYGVKLQRIIDKWKITGVTPELKEEVNEVRESLKKYFPKLENN